MPRDECGPTADAADKKCARREGEERGAKLAGGPRGSAGGSSGADRRRAGTQRGLAFSLLALGRICASLNCLRRIELVMLIEIGVARMGFVSRAPYINNKHTFYLKITPFQCIGKIYKFSPRDFRVV